MDILGLHKKYMYIHVFKHECFLSNTCSLNISMWLHVHVHVYCTVFHSINNFFTLKDPPSDSLPFDNDDASFSLRADGWSSEDTLESAVSNILKNQEEVCVCVSVCLRVYVCVVHVCVCIIQTKKGHKSKAKCMYIYMSQPEMEYAQNLMKVFNESSRFYSVYF